MDAYDIAIVGAGIAGASLAAGVGAHARVVLLEAEDQPGYHSTGRSAAFWTESYGGPHVLPLTAASGDFLREHGLLAPRGALTLARREELAGLNDFADEFGKLGVRVEFLERQQLEARVPGLKPDWRHGVLEPDCCDIDVAGLHQLWLAEAKRSGVELLCRSRLASTRREGGSWRIGLQDGRELAAAVLVNAAGAWADEVGAMAGATPLGIQPYRRTIAQLRMGIPVPQDLPLVLGFDGSFYFRPDGDRLWLSPHDESPTPPCDAAPEELDLAIAIDRFEQVTDWPITRIERKWAGLRSFAPDRLPVYGFDPATPGLFWMAGQGGFGIQTAPAAMELAGRLLLGEPAGAIDPSPYLPNRFR